MLCDLAINDFILSNYYVWDARDYMDNIRVFIYEIINDD